MDNAWQLDSVEDSSLRALVPVVYFLRTTVGQRARSVGRLVAGARIHGGV